MKLQSEERETSKSMNHYAVAQTPYQRLLPAGTLEPEVCRRLEQFYEALDPVEPLEPVEALHVAFWQLAWNTADVSAARSEASTTAIRHKYSLATAHGAPMIAARVPDIS